MASLKSWIATKLLNGDPHDVFAPQISFFDTVDAGQGGHTSFPIYSEMSRVRYCRSSPTEA